MGSLSCFIMSIIEKEVEEEVKTMHEGTPYFYPLETVVGVLTMVSKKCVSLALIPTSGVYRCRKRGLIVFWQKYEVSKDDLHGYD